MSTYGKNLSAAVRVSLDDRRTLTLEQRVFNPYGGEMGIELVMLPEATAIELYQFLARQLAPTIGADAEEVEDDRVYTEIKPEPVRGEASE